MHRQHGFTVIEIMVVVTIMGVLGVIAYPNIKTAIVNSNLKTVAQSLTSSLKQARSDAMTKRQNTTFQPIVVSGVTKTWSDGWQWQTTSTTLGTSLMPSSNGGAAVSIKLTASGSTTALTDIPMFALPDGYLAKSDGSAFAQDVRFLICMNNYDGELGYDVTLNRFGRVFLARHTSATACQ